MKSLKETIPCPKCKKFITRRGMPMHLKSHEPREEKNRYKCTKCSYATPHCGNFGRHMKVMHSNKDNIKYLTCSECSFKTLEKARLRRHMTEIHSPEAPMYQCGQCQFSSKHKLSLSRHIQTTHGHLKPETCPVCFIQSANIYSLRTHMKKHKREGKTIMFHCNECPFKTKHSGDYKAHISKHKSEDEVQSVNQLLVELYECTNCSFRTNNKHYWTEHIEKSFDTSSLGESVSCSSCCFKTSDENSLQKHMSRLHNKDEVDPTELCYCELGDSKNTK